MSRPFPKFKACGYPYNQILPPAQLSGLEFLDTTAFAAAELIGICAMAGKVQTRLLLSDVFRRICGVSDLLRCKGAIHIKSLHLPVAWQAAGKEPVIGCRL